MENGSGKWKWKVESGSMKCEMKENGKWKVNEKLTMESGKMRVENEKCEWKCRMVIGKSELLFQFKF